MLQTWRNSSKLFSDFNNLQFAGVMGMVFFVMLLVFMADTAPDHYGVPVDLAKVSHPIPMADADREDAMLVVVTRDSSVYFDSDRITTDSLASRIQDRLKDPGVERKIYIKADAHARWGTVKPVLDGVRSAGLLRVTFLVEQGRSPLH